MSSLCSSSKTRPDRADGLRAEISALRRKRRSGCHFIEWRPDIFYYLFAVVASALTVLLTGLWRRMWGACVGGGIFLALCYAPGYVNRVRYEYLVRRPNRRLQQQIESLTAQAGRGQ